MRGNRIILKWVLNCNDLSVWTGFIWLSTGIKGWDAVSATE